MLLCAGMLVSACDSGRQVSRGLSNLTNYGSLEVRSQPSGARVYVDNKYVGATPERVSLNRGKHLVLVKKSGYRTAEVWTDVAAGQNSVVDVNLEAD
ncbi:PEGA domain-containing protein [bacterium]|nr:PEGA domain-containing protein [bacterium]